MKKLKFILALNYKNVFGIYKKKPATNHKSQITSLKFISLLSRLCLALLILPMGAMAETPEEKGLNIAMEADKRDKGYVDYTANLLMILKNRHGQRSERKIRVKTLEVEGDGDKSITLFDKPGDVKGTVFLNYTHKKGDDDQWLYLPALKKVKRISSRNKSGSFMGTEFAYEDLSSQEVDKYTYKYIRDETLDGRECFVIERYPVDKKNSGYTRQVVSIGKKEYREWKVDYYDRKNSLLKTLTYQTYQKYLGKYWRPDEMFMTNHLTGKSTRLKWSGYKFRSGLKEKDFSKNRLGNI